MTSKKIDTQDTEPENKIELSEVGITNFKTLLRINRGGRLYTFIPTCKVTLNLPHNRKGAHLSRLVESVSQILSKRMNEHNSIEEMSIDSLKMLYQKHTFKKAQMRLNFDFIMRRESPVSKKRTLEVYPMEVLTFAFGDSEYYHRITIESKGNTVCPHAFAESNENYTHIQRAIGKLSIECELGDVPLYERLADMLEASYSAPTFSVLKTPDEKETVKRMFENPLFSEDVCRNILVKASDLLKERVNIIAKVQSEESIHKHDVLSKGFIIRNKKLEEIFKRTC